MILRASRKEVLSGIHFIDKKAIVAKMTIPLQIKTLIFDLDGTLIHQHPSSLDILFSVLDEHDIPLMSSAYRDTLQFIFQYWADSNQVDQDLKKYGDFTTEFWTYYLIRKLRAAGLNKLQAAKLGPVIQPIFEERYKPEKKVMDDVIPTLKNLRAQGYRIGLVSNRSNPVDEEMEELGFSPYFDFYFTAGEINSWKPDLPIFERAIYLAGSLPEETAYIGDNYYTDIVGAHNAGLHPILYDPRNIFPDADCQVITMIGSLCSHI